MAFPADEHFVTLQRFQIEENGAAPNAKEMLDQMPVMALPYKPLFLAKGFVRFYTPCTQTQKVVRK